MIIRSEKEIERIYNELKPKLEIFYKKRIDPTYIMLDSDYDNIAKDLGDYFFGFYIDTPWFDYIDMLASEILFRPDYMKVILDKVWTKKEAKDFALTNFIIKDNQISFNDEIKG